MTTSKAGKQAWLTNFIPHRREMLRSASWQARPVPLARILERLEIEYLQHGGANNGQLYVSHSQFVTYRVSRRVIAATLALGEKLGLLEVIKESSCTGGNLRPPNRYRLTYVPKRGAKAPTDEWKNVTEARAKKYVVDYRARVKRAK